MSMMMRAGKGANGPRQVSWRRCCRAPRDSSAQGQGDHHFELDELSPNSNENFPEQDRRETPMDEDTPELPVEAQVNFGIMKKSTIDEHNTKEEIAPVTATSHSPSDRLVGLTDLLYTDDNCKTTSIGDFTVGGVQQYWPETLIHRLIQEPLVRFELRKARKPDSDSRWLLEASRFFMEHGFKDSWLSAEVNPPKFLTPESLKQLDPELWSPRKELTFL
ncbi:hypothetical protein B0T26DRAFT_735648 [Lasiosphaeria miniovina]|uniref:Uncharacterized protein n=1 Tax=Lasiosphaeria miniovina TaxID=1954250 RepID=A0AA39ZR52_9PEZI|nr:uncharacterized protein B0T26DRAFT_735648 [Lasiosphaeria miniovina]KAK0702042.1 hypothetical protein B0T26DRAFT_735648 [Lasiosphaeria miniovina]